MTKATERPALPVTDMADALAALRQAGHRVSAPARRVLDALFAAEGPLSAERIAESVALDLTSVYRNLDRLQALGVVGHVHIGHGAGLYALARGGPREYLVCERCDRVTSVAPALLEPVRAYVLETFGYSPRFTHFPIHGYCAGCLEALHAQGEAMTESHDHADHHAHEHSHGDVTHSHAHTDHDHDHVDHEHEDDQGDYERE
jgi:Fur family ferric uptake transcriptional regulator